jgi:hypothetical protein
MVHGELWAGVELKLRHAEFHLQQMRASIQPPPRTQHSVAMESAGIWPDWQEAFYAHLDAFLSVTRSVGQVIKYCFGVDEYRDLKQRFSTLPTEEQDRRRKFQRQFGPHLTAFERLLLSASRNISDHREGYASVAVVTTGPFTVTYIGDPVTSIPIVETQPQTREGLPWVPTTQVPVRPKWEDFKIDGQPLFPTCQEHLKATHELVAIARRLAAEVHGDRGLTQRW